MVYTGDASVKVKVTDTYSVDKKGSLSLDTGNEVSCYASMNGYEIGFGAPNSTVCSAESGAYSITFRVYANDQYYNVGSVKLSADDVKRIAENYGLEGETPEPEPTPTPTPTPSPEPEQPADGTPFTLRSDAGIELTFYPETKQFDIGGKSVLGKIELAAYSLEAPGTYSVSDGVLSFSPANLKVTALHDLAKSSEGTFELCPEAAQSASGAWTVTLPIGDPQVKYTLTAQQAEQIGLPAGQGEDEPSSPSDPGSWFDYIPDIREIGAALWNFITSAISEAGKIFVRIIEPGM